MNKQENDIQTIIEDLAVDEARQDEVKGGTDRDKFESYLQVTLTN